MQAFGQLALEQRKRDEEAHEEQRKRDEEAREEQRKRDEKIFTILQSSQTEVMSMSDATNNFASPLLAGLGITWSRADGNTEFGQNFNFSWDGGEVARTGEAIKKLKTLFGEISVENDIRQLEFFDAHTRYLVPLTACHKKARGKTDAVIRFKEILVDDQAAFAYVISVTEFKTMTADLQLFQELLELVAMSRMSKYGQAVVLLGTDLNSKWQVCYFDRLDHITCQSFQYGSVALDFVKKMLHSVHQRTANLLPLPSIPEVLHENHIATSDQDLGGFRVQFNTTSDLVQDLQQLARHFKERFDADVNVPAWVYSSDLPTSCYGIYT